MAPLVLLNNPVKQCPPKLVANMKECSVISLISSTNMAPLVLLNSHAKVKSQHTGYSNEVMPSKFSNIIPSK